MIAPILLCSVLAGVLIAGPALADPCEAPVKGYHAGDVVSGRAVYVGDGDMVCIGKDRDPNHWLEIRLADFRAPELSEPGGRSAKTALERATRGQTLRCVATLDRRGKSTRSYDRLIATCYIKNRSLGDLLREQGVVEGGR